MSQTHGWAARLWGPALCRSKGVVPLWCARGRTGDEPRGGRNPQVKARGFYEPVEHPLAGTHRFPAMPVRFGRQPDRWFTRPAPTLGEHNAEVLGGLLGVDDELARLEAAQVIGTLPAFAPSSSSV